jgi:type III secretory pathway lipoprotein EscJ
MMLGYDRNYVRLERASFAGFTVSNISVVINMAEVKHQAQVAPMTKGSKKVR